MTAKQYLRKPPAYPQYASDMLATENYRLMTLAERGLLDTLRNQCWVSGSIPDDLDQLSRLTGTDKDELTRHMTLRVRSFFEPSSSESQRLVCPELVKERARMDEQRAERSRSGKKGAKAKWAKEKRGMAEPMAEPSARAVTSPEMSRAEKIRDELSRKESPRKDSPVFEDPAHKEWAEDYERGEVSQAEKYRKASDGD